MKILVLNCGSSSLKYQLMDMETEEVIASGKYERIGEQESFITHKACGKKVTINHVALDHTEAIDFALKQFTNPEYKVIDSLNEINAVGHRLLHGGYNIAESVLIDEDVISVLEEFSDLGPLHNPAQIKGIRVIQKVMPGVPNVGVFDTAFHQTIPEENYIYPIPNEFLDKYKVRKYGFHGTSHMFVSQRLSELEEANSRVVTCHLGQGSSICAVKDGKSIDTSMGLTPLGGIPMVTRSGDLDPSVVTYIMQKENLTASEVETVLNKKSGLMGVSGLAPDFREISNAADNGDKKAQTAMKMFYYSVASYIAKYGVAMGGIDSIVFTGGIGENQIGVREEICNRLSFLGVKIDKEANNMRGEEKLISSADSTIKVWVIPTNEELMIAKETQRLSK